MAHNVKSESSVTGKGSLKGKGIKVAIIIADFYPEISKALLDSCISVLEKEGIGFDIKEANGCLEIPIIMGTIDYSLYHGYIALGCVIKGETDHYDIVVHHSYTGLMNLAISHRLLLSNGIITVENKEQALNRTYKGSEAAYALIRLIKK